MSHIDTDDTRRSSGPAILWTGSTDHTVRHAPMSEEMEASITTGTGADTLASLRQDSPAHCVVYTHEPGIDPVAFLQAVRVQAPAIPLFLLVDEHDESLVDRAYRAGVTDCLVSREHDEQLYRLFSQAATRHQQSLSLASTGPSRKAVIESLPDGIGVIRDGSFVAVNRALQGLVETGTGGFTDVEPRDLVDPELIVQARTDETVEGKPQVPVSRPAGPSVLADVTVAPIEWQGQSAVVVICRDQTPTGYGHIPEPRQRLRTAIEATDQAVYTTGADGTIKYVNDAFEELTGYGAEEVIGKTPRVLRSGLMPEGYYENLWDTLRDGETWQDVVANRRQDGDIYYAEQTIAPLGTGDEFDGSVAIQSDVTTQIAIEDDLRAFKSIVERIEDPIMIQDLDGTFQVVNDALADLAGIPKGDLIGEDEFAFMDESSAQKIAEMKQRVIDKCEPISYQVSPKLPNAGERTFSTLRYPRYDNDGTPIGTIAICRDVSEIKEHQRQFQVVERVLRHNIRNHVQVIRGVTEQIADQGDSDMVATVLETSDALVETVEKQRQITELLSEAESAQQLDIARTTDLVVERARNAYPNATISVDTPEQCCVSAVSSIQRAIEELIENAVVHSDRAHPTVDVTVTENDHSVSITIADDGPGIPKMERDVLTGREEIRPLYHGRGIGMWVVHLIVHQSNGMLKFRENEPRGSVVSLEVPRTLTD